MRLAGIEMNFSMSFAQMTFLYTSYTFPRLELTLLSSELSKDVILDYMTNEDNSFVEKIWKKQQIDHDKVPNVAKNSNDAFYMELRKGVDLSLSDCPFLDHLKVENINIGICKIYQHLQNNVGCVFQSHIPIDYYPL